MAVTSYRLGPNLDGRLGVGHQVVEPGWVVRGSCHAGEDRAAAVVEILIGEWCDALVPLLAPR